MAVQRNSSSQKETPSKSTLSKYSNPISSIQYDYLSRPLDPATGKDGSWDTFNPIDPLTGLLRHSDNPYQEPTSQNSNSPNVNVNGDGNADADVDVDSPHHPLWTQLFAHGMTTSLLSTIPTLDHKIPMFMIESSYNPPSNRQKTIEILFETLEAPAAFLGRDAVMSCYACGRTTGVVVDMASLKTTVTPVYDGFVEQRGIIQSPIGTTTGLDEYVLKRLDQWRYAKEGRNKKEVSPLYQVKNKGLKRNDHFHRLCRLDMARNLRENIALTAEVGYDASPSDLDSSMHSNPMKHLPKLTYKLPDGTNVEIECEERYNIPELWFGRDEDNTTRREDACRLHQKKMTQEAAAMEELEAARAANSPVEGSSTTHNANSSSPLHSQNLPNHFSNTPTPSKSSFSPPPLSSHPLPNIICDAAFQCDRDQQAQLLANVILSGGGSCIADNYSHNIHLTASNPNSGGGGGTSTTSSTSNHLPERIREEVEAIIHTHTPGWKVKVLAPPMPERSVSAWLGGSILASLGSFKEMWITKQEYEENGSSIVNRKCP